MDDYVVVKISPLAISKLLMDKRVNCIDKGIPEDMKLVGWALGESDASMLLYFCRGEVSEDMRALPFDPVVTRLDEKKGRQVRELVRVLLSE